MGHRHFEKVACIVHLVFQPEVIPALLQSGDDEITDQEPVRLLGGKDAFEDGVHALAQRRVREVLQRIERAFECLVQVRIERMVALERPVELAGRLVEVGDVSVFLEFVERVGNGDLMVGLEPRCPKAAAQFHLPVADLGQAAQRRRTGGGRTERAACQGHGG